MHEAKNCLKQLSNKSVDNRHTHTQGHRHTYTGVVVISSAAIGELNKEHWNLKSKVGTVNSKLYIYRLFWKVTRHSLNSTPC